MVIVDKKIFSGGITMLIAGITISLYLNSVIPIGTTEMGEEETIDFLLKQRENQDMNA